MASSDKNRQKKLAKQKKKRSLHKKALNAVSVASKKASTYTKYPILECLVPSNLFETGLGNVVVARQLPDGSVAASVFVVDVYCLGIKDAFFQIFSALEYKTHLKEGMVESHGGIPFDNVHPSCVKKIIEGAVRYAKQLGFTPHEDYYKAIGLLGGIDSSVCPVSYEYGRDGKPFYVRGPHETIPQARRIIESLNKQCGDGGYDYMLQMVDDMF